MKSIFTSLLLVLFLQTHAQWSNTTNQFTDDMHMPVCIEDGAQSNSFILKSYPDDGYFIIWQDSRIWNNLDIYAQKYDKNGVAQWQPNGRFITGGPSVLGYTMDLNYSDYRDYSFAATDSAGGFYVCWKIKSSAGNGGTGIAIQHTKSDGTLMFGAAGKTIRETTAPDNYLYTNPQLIADERKGFYISYIKTKDYWSDIIIENYKPNGNDVVWYSSELMNQMADQKSAIYCVDQVRYSIDFFNSSPYLPPVSGYHIWPDRQGGCNIVMNLAAGSNGKANVPKHQMIAFNAVKRVKKACTTTVYLRIADLVERMKVVTHYPADTVVKLYRMAYFTYDDHVVNCKINSTKFEDFGLGYDVISDGIYSQAFAKGTTIPTEGNINVTAVAAAEQNYRDNKLTPTAIKMYAWAEEIYDSIPYEKTSFGEDYFYVAHNITRPASIDKLLTVEDTIIGLGTGRSEFSIAGSQGNIFATARLFNPTDAVNEIYLQQIKVVRESADSFSFKIQTDSKKGRLIGKERSASYYGYYLSYDNPQVKTSEDGNALFYISESNRSIRVSPIDNGGVLRWGAMGKPITAHAYLVLADPNAFIDLNGEAVITWTANDKVYPTSGNIIMRHLDELGLPSMPAINPITALKAGTSYAAPAMFLGASKKWNTIDAYNTSTSTPVISILDNYNLGFTGASVYENTGAVRKYNNIAYLDRNYTIKPENNLSGNKIGVRLYFTTDQFNALRAADAEINDPGDLMVIKQPDTGYDPHLFTHR